MLLLLYARAPFGVGACLGQRKHRTGERVRWQQGSFIALLHGSSQALKVLSAQHSRHCHLCCCTAAVASALCFVQRP